MEASVYGRSDAAADMGEAMSLDAMKQALEVLSLELPIGSHIELKNALRAAIEQTNDWDEVEALRESLREHMAEIHRLRQWQSLTDNEIAFVCGECAASAHQTDDLSYARAIEARLREKNT